MLAVLRLYEKLVCLSQIVIPWYAFAVEPLRFSANAPTSSKNFFTPSRMSLKCGRVMEAKGDAWVAQVVPFRFVSLCSCVAMASVDN